MESNMVEMMVFMVVVLIIEAVRFEIDRRDRVKRQKAFENFTFRVLNEMDDSIRSTGSLITEQVEKIATENSKFIETIQGEFEDELIEAQDKRDEAVRNLDLYISAVRSLDLNYRKKVQYQIDRIIGKRKPEEASQDGNKVDIPADETPQDSGE